MIKYYGWIRISTDAQEAESQKMGVLEYANRLGFAPVEFISATVGRSIDWQTHELGALLKRAKRGDVILTSEFTRLGERPGQVFTFLEAASAKGVIIHITKTGTVMDGSMQSQLFASAFSMASMIELAFVRQRTKEGLQRAKRDGKRLGRPPGTRGRSKLDEHEETIRAYLAIELSQRKIAKKLGVADNTLRRFLLNKGLIPK